MSKAILEYVRYHGQQLFADRDIWNEFEKLCNEAEPSRYPITQKAKAQVESKDIAG